MLIAFQMVGFSDGKAATALMGAVTVLAYLATPFLVERTGRRIMLNISAVGKILFVFIVQILYESSSSLLDFYHSLSLASFKCDIASC